MLEAGTKETINVPEIFHWYMWPQTTTFLPSLR